MTQNWLHFDRFAVFGLGKSGIAVSNLLAERGKRVVASDTAARESLRPGIERVDEAVELVCGGHRFEGAEVVVVSPGLSPDLEIVGRIREAGLPIVSEIEIAYDAARAPVAAITGTDGKTTTTALLGHIAELSERPSAVGGNIGTPLSAVVDEVPAGGLVVAEVSAFQLWSIHHFRPRIAGFTNIAGDHLDYFETRREYREAKRRLESNMRGDDLVVYNLDDPVVETWSRNPPAERGVYGFEVASSVEAEVAVREQGGAIVAECDGRTFELLEHDDLALPGDHNLSNAMCASAMALAAEIDAETVAEGLASFEPLPHRIEPCGSIDGVEFVNDSKATNVNAALAGLSSIDGPLVAVVGGVDEGLELAPLCRHLAEHAVGVVVIGEMASRLSDELAGFVDDDFRLEPAESLEEATRLAYRWARESAATVTLSPACSSFDMFDSYEDRGESFRRAVERLRSEHGG